jgi:hypothetical protein
MSRAQRTLRACGWAGLALAKAGTIAFTLEGVLWPDQPKYKGKAMRIRSLGYFGGLALVPAVWAAGGRDPRYPLVADLAMTTPLLIDAAGNSLGIYDSARIDDVVHFMNAVALAGLFGAAISNHVHSRERAAAATVVFGLVGEACFDLMEYGAERLGYTGLGLSVEDTVADTALAALGTTVAAVVTWARWKPADQREHAASEGRQRAAA